jgi:hypothetical protein
MKYEIRSVGLWSFIKQCFFLSLIVGFIVGIFYALFFGLMLNVSSRFDLLRSTNEDFASTSFGVLMVVIPFGMALVSCAFNTLLGVIALVCYNGLAKLIGGLELDLVPVATEAPAAILARPIAGSASDSLIPPPPPPYGATAAAPPSAPEQRHPEPPASKYE